MRPSGRAYVACTTKVILMTCAQGIAACARERLVHFLIPVKQVVGFWASYDKSTCEPADCSATSLLFRIQCICADMRRLPKRSSLDQYVRNFGIRMPEGRSATFRHYFLIVIVSVMISRESTDARALGIFFT